MIGMPTMVDTPLAQAETVVAPPIAIASLVDNTYASMAMMGKSAKIMSGHITTIIGKPVFASAGDASTNTTATEIQAATFLLLIAYSSLWAPNQAVVDCRQGRGDDATGNVTVPEVSCWKRPCRIAVTEGQLDSIRGGGQP